MTYELAKKLKEAGFPQNTIKRDDMFECPINSEDTLRDRVLLPTLSELIEACGNSNLRLQSGSKGKWSAYSFLYVQTGNGETPEEAVANLWLKLNKKP